MPAPQDWAVAEGPGGGPRTVVEPPPPGWAQVNHLSLTQHPPGPEGSPVSEALTAAWPSWRRSCPLQALPPAPHPRGCRLCPHPTRWMASPAVPSAGPGPGAPIVPLSSAIRATSRSSRHCPCSKVSPVVGCQGTPVPEMANRLQGVVRSSSYDQREFGQLLPTEGLHHQS